MSHFLRPVLVGVLTAILLAGLSWLIRRAKPAALADEQGRIMPERWSAWFTVLAGLGIFGVGIWQLISGVGGSGWASAGVALMGIAIAGFMAPSLTTLHSVSWNATGVEGPANTFGPTLGTARTEISWAEIVGAGKTSAGYWFVEARDGRRVYWSFFHKGYGALTAALRSRCRALALPSDLR